jgi:hypothetical protein
VVGEVEGQTAELENRSGVDRAALCKRADTRKQFAEVEGLDQVVGARVEAEEGSSCGAVSIARLCPRDR